MKKTKKILLILIMLIVISTNYTFASTTEPIDTTAIEQQQLNELIMIREILESIQLTLNSNNLEIITLIDENKKYVILTFLVVSIFCGFLIGYLLGRKKV